MWEFWDSHLRVPGQNDIWVLVSWLVYYKGEGGGFPQIQAVVSLMNLSLPLARLSTKSVQTMH
jgi:hypothetical protein